MDVLNFEGYISIPIIILCFGLGVVIKAFLPKIKNEWIPAINVIFGVIMEFLIAGFKVDSALTGIISGFASTGAYELIKNTILNKYKYIASDYEDTPDDDTPEGKYVDEDNVDDVAKEQEDTKDAKPTKSAKSAKKDAKE